MAEETRDERLHRVIREQLGLADDLQIGSTTDLSEDLNADSLDKVELVMAVEDEFNVEIPDEDAEAVKTVGDYSALLDRLEVK